MIASEEMKLEKLCVFGHDTQKEEKVEQERRFISHYPDFGPIFHNVVNGEYRLFHESVYTR